MLKLMETLYKHKMNYVHNQKYVSKNSATPSDLFMVLSWSKSVDSLHSVGILQ